MVNSLHNLAEKAGIEILWRDVDGIEHVVSDENLIAVLCAIGLPGNSSQDIRSSHEKLFLESQIPIPLLITADVNEPVFIKNFSGFYKIELEAGNYLEGYIVPGAVIPPITEPGYHRFISDDIITTIAVAPKKAFTLEDAAQGDKIWGLSVQLYALRQAGDGGIGNFSALATLAKSAASYGADALAISPVNAQFSSIARPFSPYSPSNRSAYNVFHIDEPSESVDSAGLIDWSIAGAAKLKILREGYTKFRDYDALAEFRRRGGIGLQRHAIFEALQASLLQYHQGAHDWRQWPQDYRDPESPAVHQFQQDNADEISYYAYLQYRADEGLRAAQEMAQNHGMKIGIITDLAVGADHSGSHSWSRQNEFFGDLEIGAPPDAINREGQSWGITAFSPRGLIASGYSAFIEMLRHSMRHAGGIRIDHVMGLARLWIIPKGCRSSDGAYLKMPLKDLMRLVVLESYRHRAVILGEDLGTLPVGFQNSLDNAGLAGLRVMWFERCKETFTPPSSWTKSAVAMTTTHDLPTVAGWWQGEDIAWRSKLHMMGDNNHIRAADRVELWSAFQKSGAINEPIPADENGAAVADAACVHLGLSNCTLALLPMEDALGLIDQPNLPGTIDQHPNWRRRLPVSTDIMLDQSDVAMRLKSLHQARQR